MKSGFKLPEDYMSDFKNRLNQRMEVESKSYESDDLKASSGYRIPDAYFEKFKVDVVSNKSTENKKLKIAIAAIAVLAISLGITFKPFTSSEQINFSDLEDEQINRYIDQQGIQDEVLDEYSSHQNSNFELNDAIKKVDQKEILNYFSDQLNDLYAYEE